MSRKRMDLDLPEESLEKFQQIADDSGKTLAEILRTGLALYGIYAEETANGRQLGVVQGDRVIKEILIPK